LGFFVTLPLPTLVTALYFILYFTPVGDIASPAYSQIDNGSVMMALPTFITLDLNLYFALMVSLEDGVDLWRQFDYLWHLLDRQLCGLSPRYAR
jgi:hypothetical protein